MIDTFLMVSKFGEDRTTHASCGCKNMVFSVMLCSAGVLFIRGEHSLNKFCVAVYGSILIVFSSFFGMDSPFRYTREFPFPFLGGTTIFAKLWSKIAKSPKICGKVCAHHFV